MHETYLRLLGQDVDWLNREHFFGVAGTLMRRILVDHARRRLAAKRRLELAGVDPDDTAASGATPIDLIALDDALTALAERGPRQARLVELRYFTGLSLEEAASVLGISEATASRDWALARAWLKRQLRAPKAG